MKDSDSKYFFDSINQNNLAHENLGKRVDQLSDKIDYHQNMIICELAKLNEKHHDNKISITKLDVRSGFISMIISAMIGFVGTILNRH